jgi:UDP-N-acetylmuramoyl-tripeptide--D-alanyl-D-alanine ligase
MRGEIHHLLDNVILIDDTYNSNPAALESALRDLSELEAKRKVGILGDMLELGESQISYHLEAGEHVKRHSWDVLITVGPLSRNMAAGALQAGLDKTQIISFEDSDEASDRVASLIEPGDLVLVKGSRGIGTDKIVETLKKRGT